MPKLINMLIASEPKRAKADQNLTSSQQDDQLLTNKVAFTTCDSWSTVVQHLENAWHIPDEVDQQLNDKLNEC